MGERRRRGHGEGSIYRMADGRWAASVDLGWVDGKRRRRVVARRTRSEVATELRRLQSEQSRGEMTQSNAPTLGAWLDRYLEEVARPKVRPSTLSRYEQETRLHLKPTLGKTRLDKLEPQHIAKLYDTLSTTLAPASIRRLHAFLRRALTVAVRWRLLGSNPALMVDPPPMPENEIEPFDRAEAVRFLQAVAGTRLEARWLIGVMLGPRQGEILGLQWTNIRFETRSITIRGSLQRRTSGELVIAPPKTKRSVRTLPMPARVEAALLRWRDAQSAERRVAGDLWVESDLVFTTALGTPIHPRNDYRTFQSILRNAAIRRVRLHDLRHTAASDMLAAGVPPRVVMEILGHSQISITMNTYTHVADSLKSDAVARIDDIYRSEEGDDEDPLG